MCDLVWFLTFFVFTAQDRGAHLHCFYGIYYKELERMLNEEQASMSLKAARDHTLHVSDYISASGFKAYQVNIVQDEQTAKWAILM